LALVFSRRLYGSFVVSFLVPPLGRFLSFSFLLRSLECVLQLAIHDKASMLYDGSAGIKFTELAVDVFDGAYSVSVNRKTDGSALVEVWCKAEGKVIW
jgi:hypothetical protein